MFRKAFEDPRNLKYTLFFSPVMNLINSHIVSTWKSPSWIIRNLKYRLQEEIQAVVREFLYNRGTSNKEIAEAELVDFILSNVQDKNMRRQRVLSLLENAKPLSYSKTTLVRKLGDPFSLSVKWIDIRDEISSLYMKCSLFVHLTLRTSRYVKGQS